MRELVFFLEERSAKELLQQLEPRLKAANSDWSWRYITFEGKQDLEKQLPLKLRHYLNPNAKFIVLRDQDSEDCKQIKDRLSRICAGAKKTEAKVRIACRELEAFYLGDLMAIEAGLNIRGLRERYEKRARYRDPDSIERPSAELERITRGTYQKIAGSRLIGANLDLDSSRSCSFRHLVNAIRSVMGQ
jgi:hypothetical protein